MAVQQVSERRACRVIGQPRATQRYPKKIDEDEEMLLLPEYLVFSFFDVCLDNGFQSPLGSNVNRSELKNGNVFYLRHLRAVCSQYGYF